MQISVGAPKSAPPLRGGVRSWPKPVLESRFSRWFCSVPSVGTSLRGGEIGAGALPTLDDPLTFQIRQSSADRHARHPELLRQAPLCRQPNASTRRFDLADHVRQLPIERTLGITAHQARARKRQVDGERLVRSRGSWTHPGRHSAPMIGPGRCETLRDQLIRLDHGGLAPALCAGRARPLTDPANREKPPSANSVRCDLSTS